jgi:hypothetical protein
MLSAFKKKDIVKIDIQDGHDEKVIANNVQVNNVNNNINDEKGEVDNNNVNDYKDNDDNDDDNDDSDDDDDNIDIKDFVDGDYKIYVHVIEARNLKPGIVIKSLSISL